jgi:hypothetical protein
MAGGGFIANIKLYGLVPLVIIILIFYIWWLLAYSVQNEVTAAILVVLLGILYAASMYLIYHHYSSTASCLGFLTMAIVISIGAITQIKKVDGSQDSNFICLGITPMLSGICFSLLTVCVWFFTKNVESFTG